METLRSTVLDTIREHAMFRHGDSVVVAVSGGPDSVCLLHLLNELRDEFSLHLRVAHLDHSTRNGESTEDALFVESLAKRMDLECHVETVDVARMKPPGGSFEAAARDLRYEFLTRVANQTGSSKIALGHTANDQAETMLMRLISGTGRRGLAGIRPVRDMDDVTRVRPLIDVKRNEILSYLESTASTRPTSIRPISATRCGSNSSLYWKKGTIRRSSTRCCEARPFSRRRSSI